MSELELFNKSALNNIKLMIQAWVREAVEEVIDQRLKEATPTEPISDERLTIKEGAQECKVKETTVRDWCRKKKIKYQRMGDRYLILRTELNNYLDTRRPLN